MRRARSSVTCSQNVAGEDRDLFPNLIQDLYPLVPWGPTRRLVGPASKVLDRVILRQPDQLPR
jgi:hypothetical protein